MRPPQTGRLAIGDVLGRIVRGGGPALSPIRPMGGGAVGAWLVRWADGRLGVLTWAPAPPPGAPAGRLDRVLALTDLARDAGLPVPMHQAVVPLASGDLAVLQEPAAGVPVAGVPGPGLVDHLLE